MPDMKTVVLGDKAVQVADTDVALIEQYKTDMARKLADAETKHVAAIAAKDEDIGKLRADLATAQAAANIDVDSLVAARTELVGQVKAMDASIDPKGKTDAELRKAAVLAKLGDSIVKDASDAEITGMFKALAKDAATTNPVATALRHGVVNVGDSNAAQSSYVARMTGQK